MKRYFYFDIKENLFFKNINSVDVVFKVVFFLLEIIYDICIKYVFIML